MLRHFGKFAGIITFIVQMPWPRSLTNDMHEEGECDVVLEAKRKRCVDLSFSSFTCRYVLLSSLYISKAKTDRSFPNSLLEFNSEFCIVGIIHTKYVFLIGFSNDGMKSVPLRERSINFVRINFNPRNASLHIDCIK